MSLEQVALALLSAAFAAGGAWAAVRGELRYLRRDVEELRALHSPGALHHGGPRHG